MTEIRDEARRMVETRAVANVPDQQAGLNYILGKRDNLNLDVVMLTRAYTAAYQELKGGGGAVEAMAGAKRVIGTDEWNGQIANAIRQGLERDFNTLFVNSEQSRKANEIVDEATDLFRKNNKMNVVKGIEQRLQEGDYSKIVTFLRERAEVFRDLTGDEFADEIVGIADRLDKVLKGEVETKKSEQSQQWQIKGSGAIDLDVAAQYLASLPHSILSEPYANLRSWLALEDLGQKEVSVDDIIDAQGISGWNKINRAGDNAFVRMVDLATKIRDGQVDLDTFNETQPVSLIELDGIYYAEDGTNRIAAAKLLGQKTIKANVKRPIGQLAKTPWVGSVEPEKLRIALENAKAAKPLSLTQCVTGDTLLRRRRKSKIKNKKADEDEWEEVRIDEIEVGDEIMTLDEKTGEFVESRILGLKRTGIKEIVKITTSSGKTIRTTVEHPYLVLATKKSAFADLVNQIGSLNGRLDNLAGSLANDAEFVNRMDMDSPGVEPGRSGLSSRPSEPAEPMSVKSIAKNLMKWIKVKDLSVGVRIATVDGFE